MQLNEQKLCAGSNIVKDIIKKLDIHRNNVILSAIMLFFDNQCFDIISRDLANTTAKF